jgi:hypothetical protein
VQDKALKINGLYHLAAEIQQKSRQSGRLRFGACADPSFPDIRGLPPISPAVLWRRVLLSSGDQTSCMPCFMLTATALPSHATRRGTSRTHGRGPGSCPCA